MYRTSELRTTKTTAKVPELSSEKVSQLSNEKRIDIASRIEMLQALAGYRWVGEASHDIHSVEPSVPTEEQRIALALLDSMGLAGRFDWLERSGKYFSWVQFAINQPMLDMFMNEERPFNVMEQGAVYGYPISATLAFARIIPRKIVRIKSVAEYYLFGINSEKYYDREVEYAEKMWAHLCEIAPKLTAEAYEDYKRITKEIATSPQSPSGGRGVAAG